MLKFKTATLFKVAGGGVALAVALVLLGYIGRQQILERDAATASKPGITKMLAEREAWRQENPIPCEFYDWQESQFKDIDPVGYLVLRDVHAKWAATAGCITVEEFQRRHAAFKKEFDATRPYFPDDLTLPESFYVHSVRLWGQLDGQDVDYFPEDIDPYLTCWARTSYELRKQGLYFEMDKVNPDDYRHCEPLQESNTKQGPAT